MTYHLSAALVLALASSAALAQNSQPQVVRPLGLPASAPTPAAPQAPVASASVSGVVTPARPASGTSALPGPNNAPVSPAAAPAPTPASPAPIPAVSPSLQPIPVAQKPTAPAMAPRASAVTRSEPSGVASKLDAADRKPVRRAVSPKPLAPPAPAALAAFGTLPAGSVTTVSPAGIRTTVVPPDALPTPQLNPPVRAGLVSTSTAFVPVDPFQPTSSQAVVAPAGPSAAASAPPLAAAGVTSAPSMTPAYRPTPANRVVSTSPANEFIVRMGDRTVRKAVERWAEQAGRQIVWTANTDYVVEADAAFGQDLREALTRLSKSLAETSEPITFIERENAIVVVRSINTR